MIKLKRKYNIANTKLIQKMQDPFWGLLAENVYIIDYEPQIDGIILYDRMGFIVDYEDIETIAKGLFNFLSTTSPQKVIEYQDAQYREYEQKRNNKQAEQPKRKKRAGYIYFVKGENDCYKIGKTSRLKERLGEYTKLPFKTTPTHIIKTADMDLTERLFHEFFENKRIRGEWFKLDPRDIDYIKGGHYTAEIEASIKGGDAQ